MPRRKDAHNLGIQLTPAQYAALEAAAKADGLKLATFIRKLLAAHVTGFKDDIQKRERRA